ncbi:MAG: molybdate ABC transporter substrate-binding protein [Dehalococcoidia bacterium]
MPRWWVGAWLLAVLAGLFPGVACAGGSEQELTVFAASSLTNAFQEVGEAFEVEHPGVQVVFNFAGSSTLRAQLEQGARADVFAPADQRQMELARQAGRVLGQPQPFATNRLVVITSLKGGGVRSLADLALPGVKVVLALPEVPAGRYAREVLARLAASPELPDDFAARVLGNVVSEEINVRQVFTKVALGEADAGIVYATDITPQVEGQVRALAIPEAYNVTALYPVATVRERGGSATAEAFVAFLRSPAGQAVLQRHGFGEAP